MHQELKSSVLADSPTQAMTNGWHKVPSKTVLVWSAADKEGLTRLATAYSSHMHRHYPSNDDDQAADYLDNLAHTLNSRRSFLAWRSFAVTKSITELQSLQTIISTPIRCRASPQMGYLFTGQGAQFAGMGSELLVYPTFRASFIKSEMYLRRLGCEWSPIGKSSPFVTFTYSLFHTNAMMVDTHLLACPFVSNL